MSTGERDRSATRTVLVTGTTGYVGSRLVPRLLDEGHRVIAASRSAGSVDRFPWAEEVEVREFDIDDDGLVQDAVEGVDALVYLVHSMESEDFEDKDRDAAERVAGAARRAGVTRIVYLSGLVPDGELSAHLRSRLEVENVLLESAVPTTVLRAAMIIGAGSTSYELLRRLSERVPLLTPVPRWMNNKIQPVAIDDVVALIAGALAGQKSQWNGHCDIGGDEVLTYPELLRAFAHAAGLTRRQILVPGIPQAVVGHACAAIASMDHTEVTTLVESLRHDMVCQDSGASDHVVPQGFAYTSVADGLRRALDPDGPPGSERGADPLTTAPTDV